MPGFRPKKNTQRAPTLVGTLCEDATAAILSIPVVPAAPSHTRPVDSRPDTHQDHFLLLRYWGDLFSNSKQLPKVHFLFVFFSSTFLYFASLFSLRFSLFHPTISTSQPLPPIPNHHPPTSFIFWYKDNASG